MYCPSCGQPNDDDAVFCQFCGSNVEEPTPAPNIRPSLTTTYAHGEFYNPPKNDDGAITSLILGIASFLICPLILAIPAIIIGNAAKQRIAQSQGALTGETMAVVGIICGWINVGISALVILIIIASAL